MKVSKEFIEAMNGLFKGEMWSRFPTRHFLYIPKIMDGYNDDEDKYRYITQGYTTECKKDLKIINESTDPISYTFSAEDIKATDWVKLTEDKD